MVWHPLAPALTPALVDARLQLHHAAQFAAVAGIAFLPHQPDDSHTSLEWVAALDALLSPPIAGEISVRIGVRPVDLHLLVTGEGNEILQGFPLHDQSIGAATAWIKGVFALLRLDPARYSLERHYMIPPHPSASGAPFRLDPPEHFEELARWLGNADMLLRSLVATTPGATPVRCWPHHFDIATLINLPQGRSIGVGLELGDRYYAEPYFYVSPHPRPPATAAYPRLGGNASWHTAEWLGAVLAGSRLPNGAVAQEREVRSFIDTAIAAARTLLGDP